MAASSAYKALADPTRREILRLLSAGELSAGELAERFDMTKPSMSHHFAALKEAGLVTTRREGQRIYYSLNTPVVQDLIAYQPPLTQVLSLPPPRRVERGGVHALGELFRLVGQPPRSES